MKSKYIKQRQTDYRLLSANKVVSAVGLFVLVVAVGVFIVYNPAFYRNNIFVILTFFINIGLFVSQLLLSSTEHSFSLKVMFWTFNLFFFGLAPFYQYVSGSYIWGYKATDREYLINNIFILAWSLLYIIGTKIKLTKRKQTKRKIKKVILQQNVEYAYTIRKTALNIMLIISVLVVAYYMAFVGFENMFFRDTSGNKAFSESTSLKLLEEHVFTNIVLYTFVIHLIEAKQKKKVSVQFVISVACLLICCFPTSLSRYAMASIYAGIMIVLFDKTRKGRWFITLFILALVVVFPGIDIFRRLEDVEEITNFGTVIKQEIENIYTTGDYDSYAMFINVRRYIGFFDFSYGKQLLGALLFFVPRAIWSGKPLGTGHTVFTAFQPEFTNVSAPLISEGYIDFGVIGIVLYSLVAGAITSITDKKYWESNNPLSTIRIVYPFILFQFFFLLRGDLMSGGAYLIARLVMGLVIYSFVVQKTTVSKEIEPPSIQNKYVKCKYIK